VLQDTRLDLAAVLPLDILYLFTGVREDIVAPHQDVVFLYKNPSYNIVLYKYRVEYIVKKCALFCRGKGLSVMTSGSCVSPGGPYQPILNSEILRDRPAKLHRCKSSLDRPFLAIGF
jgi:hypothetical protein